MKEISLFTRSGDLRAIALVDDLDLELVSKHRWHLDSHGYVNTHIDHPAGGVRLNGRCRQTLLPLHRLICGLEFGDKREPDHINRNPLDNRRENLRVGTKGLNKQNMGAWGRSKYRGVSWDKKAKKWTARVSLEGHSHFLGHFEDEDEAGRIAAEWRYQHMPFAEPVNV